MSKLTYRGYPVPEEYVSINSLGHAWMDGIDLAFSVTEEVAPRYEYFKSTLVNGPYWRYPEGSEQGEFNPNSNNDHWVPSHTQRSWMVDSLDLYQGEYVRVSEDEVPLNLRKN